MRSYLLIGLAAGTLSACVQPPQDIYVASSKSALELRSIQTRTVPADTDTTMRGVIATLHDLGYRITRVSPEAGTVSGARQATLRMAVVVQPKGDRQSAVRANASILSPRLETQVDSAEFYQRNFFEPLGATMGRTPEALRTEDAAPDAARPVAELNTANEREAAAKAAAVPKQE